MNDNDKQSDLDKIKCEECMKWVPKSEMKIEEAADYVRYFCGLECYEKWIKQNNNKKIKD